MLAGRNSSQKTSEGLEGRFRRQNSEVWRGEARRGVAGSKPESWPKGLAKELEPALNSDDIGRRTTSMSSCAIYRFMQNASDTASSYNNLVIYNRASSRDAIHPTLPVTLVQGKKLSK